MHDVLSEFQRSPFSRAQLSLNVRVLVPVCIYISAQCIHIYGYSCTSCIVYIKFWGCVTIYLSYSNHALELRTYYI